MKISIALLLSLVLGLAACGDDENTEPGDAASGPAPAAETTTPEDSGGGGGDAVAIVDFEFEPKQITVSAGDKIEWTNEDTANHNVIFDGDDPDDIDNLRQDESGSVTFDKAGTYDYVCSYHPGMEGSVTVE